MKARDVAIALALSAGLVVVGVGLIWTPLAFIVAGASLAAIVLFVDLGS